MVVLRITTVGGWSWWLELERGTRNAYAIIFKKHGGGVVVLPVVPGRGVAAAFF